MPKSFLLSRLLLRFPPQYSALVQDLSAVAFTPDGSLWVGSDETTHLERLSPAQPYIFDNHHSFNLKDFLTLETADEEIDIEGLCYEGGYLWLCGSHSPKRKKAKGKSTQDDMERLATIKTEKNRYFLARVPSRNGELFKSFSDQNLVLTAASLKTTENGNLLTDALLDDPHLGLSIKAGIPSKENGFDVEGLAVCGDKIFLGLRGPVLRGWAVILELEVKELEPGILGLKNIGDKGEFYRKHFLDLNGLGVRELCIDGEDLIILAGPTMTVDGDLRVFRWQQVLNRGKHTLTSQKSGELEVLFDLPFTIGGDRAEGLSLMSCLGEEKALLVVYDSPSQDRMVGESGVFADVFRLSKNSKDEAIFPS
ncbi:DUF3616 domain-containing protein [Ancylothrix sp. C2]|uniref:DUF3616 domain-containing protein n=1 Tax=Ancylothrix sp. D3o TaxID=2953691 RepID=UPI0021BB0CA7|nr:DUF3616 domain-containing protein [Ancylothrix sp. D3o]MCT7949937.1 DUF3616 domain-containing protein [Ancylothrix sp. D3o]